MTDKEKDLVIEAAEKLGWWVRFYEQTVAKLDSMGYANGEEIEYVAEFGKHSPAGEDFFFDVFYDSAESLLNEVFDYAACFDVDEHVELWMGSRGKRGVPGTIRELLEDAEAIEKMVRDLANALEELMEGSEYDRESVEDW